MNKRNLCLSVSLLLGLVVTGHICRAEDYKETGHIGVEGLVLAIGTQTGVVYESSRFEIMADINATSTQTKPYSGGVDLSVRGGLRSSLGSGNYFSYGVVWDNNLFGSSRGVSTAGSNFIGPYVGFQRYWNANVMLTFYVSPVDYNHSVSNDGNGGKLKTNTYEFFNEGGVGVAYLF